MSLFLFCNNLRKPSLIRPVVNLFVFKSIWYWLNLNRKISELAIVIIIADKEYLLASGLFNERIYSVYKWINNDFVNVDGNWLLAGC